VARVSRKQNKYIPKVQNTAMKIALYVRLSNEDNGGRGKDSIQNQIELLMEFAEQVGQSEISETYIDNGHTGTDFERPEWERMLEDIKNHKVNCVIVKDLSRFARNYLEAGDYLEKIFPFLGVRFIAVNDQYDSKNELFPEKELITEFKNLANDYYSRDISKKIMSSFKAKKAQGQFIGSKAPYGYILKDNQFVPDEPAASIVKRIFSMKMQGISAYEIAGTLNRENIPSPSRYAGEHGAKKYKDSSNVAWQPQAITRILYNQVYVGDLVQGKYNHSIYSQERKGKRQEEMWEITENIHEPIIDRDIFLQIQQMKRKNSKIWKDRQGRSAYENILEGILVCGICKHSLRRLKDIRKGKARYFFYCASSYNYVQSKCSSASIVDHKLFDAILEQIKLQINLAVELEDFLKKMEKSESYSKNSKRKQDELKETKNKLDRTIYLKSSIYEDFKHGILTKQEYLTAKEKYSLDIEMLEDSLNRQQKELEEFKQCMSTENKWLKAFLAFKGADELTRNMAQALLERVEVYEERRIHIIYRFRSEYEYLMQRLRGTKEGADYGRRVFG